MIIVHICLAAKYVEGWGYQENIIPKYHALNNDVFVLSSDFSIDSKGNAETKSIAEYTNSDGIHIKILKKKYSSISFLNIYKDVLKNLEDISPDIIFVHGGQFLSLKDVIKYCSHHKNTRLFIDQHGDYYNMPISNCKKKILQKNIYGHYMRKAVKYTSKFWGVTPWRCQYLNEVYNIPYDKIGLLVMGGDDQYIHLDRASEIRNTLRNEYHISQDDFVLVTGGKIDKTKNIHLLMQAVKDINDDSLKLIVFGQPDNEMKQLIDELSMDKHIINIGWIHSEKVYDYFIASDLAVFPGTHSVLWEQSGACGIPGIYKQWDGMTHINVNGSAMLLSEVSSKSIADAIKSIYLNRAIYDSMKKSAEEFGVKTFSYKEISRRAISVDE